MTPPRKWQTILSTCWIDLSSTENHELFTCFLDLKIGYDTTQTCAHLCKTSRYINNKKIYCKAKYYIQILNFVQVAYIIW